MKPTLLLLIVLSTALSTSCARTESRYDAANEAAVIAKPEADPRGPLTRPLAEKLIRANSNFPIKEDGPSIGLSWDGYCFNNHIDPCTPEAMPYEVKTLQDLGLITVAFEGGTSRISITEKGNQYVLGEPTERVGESGGRFSTIREVSVISATVDFGQITGIQEFPQFNQAKVEYTVVSQPTPFGANPVPSYNRRYDLVAIAKSATFTKYDDGWRLTGSN